MANHRGKTKKMKKSLVLFWTMLAYQSLIAQSLTAPQAQGVWGGRILDISAIPIHADTTRVFVSTESANTAFFADVFHGSASRFGLFKPVKGMGLRDNYGDNINWIQAHETSGRLYFIAEGKLLSTHPKTTGVSTHLSFGVSSFLIHGDTIFICEGNKLHWGTLGLSGTFTAHSASPITLASFTAPPLLVIDPFTDSLYAFNEGTSPKLYGLSDTYKGLSASTGYRSVPLSAFAATTEWRTFGIGPDGRFFMAGADFNPGPMPSSNQIGYSDNQGQSWSFHAMNLPGPPGGATGPNFDFTGNTSAYSVFLGDAYNNKEGAAGHWKLLGTPGGTNRFNVANDGPVLKDPIADSVLYFITNQGLGYSTDSGASVWGFNRGITAVQVYDIDMRSDYKTAWVASKSGIRKVTNFKSGNPIWYWTQFPTGDGSPYFSADMALNDTDKVFVGNSRVYRTRDGGGSWKRVFDPELSPFNYPRIGTEVQALEVCPFDTSVIMAAYYVQGGSQGGLFVSHDGGNHWSQILIATSSVGSDVNLLDVVFAIEGVDTVAYVSADVTSSGESVYRVVKSGTVWTASQDMGATGTATATAYSLSITDIELSSSGDTVFACGFDPSSNAPVVFMKDLAGLNLWTSVASVSLSTAVGYHASAITLGVDTLYCAIDEEIMWYPLKAASPAWSSAYTYPKGTKINFLYYDELLVGTSHGLYAQYGKTATKVHDVQMSDQGIELFPNPVMDELSIKLDGQVVSGDYQIEVVGLNGKRELREKIRVIGGRSQVFSLATDALEPGVYALRIFSNSENIYSTALVKK